MKVRRWRVFHGSNSHGALCEAPDDKNKVGEPDRSRVAEKQDYEVRYLAQKYGLDREQARNLIARVGMTGRNSTKQREN